ncbi:MAG: GNAT family N-acetyltransferase [Pseudomonadota bacterium]
MMQSNQDDPMIEHCNIRDAVAADLPRLHEIRMAAYEPVYRSFRAIVGEAIAPIAFKNAEAEQGAYLDGMFGEAAAHEVLVAERAGEVVAFCAVRFDHESKLGEVNLNAVHPDHQNKGVGAWMYEAALDRLRARGMEAATVGTGGDPSHAAARRAYEKAGFGPALPSVYYYRML